MLGVWGDFFNIFGNLPLFGRLILMIQPVRIIYHLHKQVLVHLSEVHTRLIACPLGFSFASLAQ